MESNKTALLIIASLRSASMIHKNNHWLTSGKEFFAKHKLFDKIYESALEDTDTMAEKFMGIFKNEWLDETLHAKLVSEILFNYNKIEDRVEKSLAVEKDIVKLLKNAQDLFEKNGDLTLGLADVLGSVSTSRETAIYFL